jgi:hypothetical protein
VNDPPYVRPKIFKVHLQRDAQRLRQL